MHESDEDHQRKLHCSGRSMRASLCCDPVPLEDGQWPLAETHIIDLSDNEITSLPGFFMLFRASAHLRACTFIVHVDQSPTGHLPPLDHLEVLRLEDNPFRMISGMFQTFIGPLLSTMEPIGVE